MREELRHALRSLLRSPGFALAAILTLGLGVGASTAIVTVGRAALLRPLPYAEPDRLVHLWETRTGRELHRSELSFPDYSDLDSAAVFERLGGYSRLSTRLTGSGPAETVSGGRVTSTFLDVLGVAPALGTAFAPGDDAPGGPKKAILSYGLWARRFGSEPRLETLRLTLDGVTYQIAGVLPARFHFAPLGTVDLLVPLDPTERETTARARRWLNVVGRLAAGTDAARARNAADTVASRLAADHPAECTGLRFEVVPLREQLAGPIRPIVVALLLAALAVLLVACLSVAGLVVARAVGRQREMAVRAALGASTWRLASPLLYEGLLVGLASTACGLALSRLLVVGLVATVPPSLRRYMPFLGDLPLDAPTISFALLAALSTALLGVGAVGRGRFADSPFVALRGGPARQRLRDVLVVSEVALSLALLAGAALLLRSVGRLASVDTGFRPEHVLALQATLPMERLAPRTEELVARLAALPGVEAVSTVSKLPLLGGGTVYFEIEGRPAPAPGHENEANVRAVGAAYFDVMGVGLLRGRAFTRADDATAPGVVIVNRLLAERFLGGADVVGRRLRVGRRSVEIVGVVGNEKVSPLDEAAFPVLYEAWGQDLDTEVEVVVRAAGRPESLAGPARRAAAADPEVAVGAVRTMEQALRESPALLFRSGPARLLLAFAALCLAVTLVGLHGLVSYAVRSRTHELGIRMTLGATGSDLFRLALGGGLKRALLGVAVGLAAAGLAGRLLSSLLFGVTPADPVALATAAAVCLLTTLAACVGPARHAARVDAVEALRSER